jgi:hypothetical protein
MAALTPTEEWETPLDTPRLARSQMQMQMQMQRRPSPPPWLLRTLAAVGAVGVRRKGLFRPCLRTPRCWKALDQGRGREGQDPVPVTMGRAQLQGQAPVQEGAEV